MQLHLDERQLGLKKDLFLYKNVIGKTRGIDFKLFQNIRLKWNALELGIREIDMEMECTDSDDCRSMKRITFLFE